MFDDKHGLGLLAGSNIQVELIVRKCPYFRKSKKQETGHIIMFGKLKMLQGKLKIVLDTISELEKETNVVPKEDLLKKLAEKRIHPDEALRLIWILLRDGTIYEAKEGCYKRT